MSAVVGVVTDVFIVDDEHMDMERSQSIVLKDSDSDKVSLLLKWNESDSNRKPCNDDICLTRIGRGRDIFLCESRRPCNEEICIKRIGRERGWEVVVPLHITSLLLLEINEG